MASVRITLSRSGARQDLDDVPDSAVEKSSITSIVDSREGRPSPSDVSSDGDHRNFHVAADFLVAIAQSMGQIDLSSTQAHRVQTGYEAIQSLLVIENLIWGQTGGYQRTLSVNILNRYFALQP